MHTNSCTSYSGHLLFGCLSRHPGGGESFPSLDHMITWAWEAFVQSLYCSKNLRKKNNADQQIHFHFFVCSQLFFFSGLTLAVAHTTNIRNMLYTRGGAATACSPPPTNPVFLINHTLSPVTGKASSFFCQAQCMWVWFRISDADHVSTQDTTDCTTSTTSTGTSTTNITSTTTTKQQQQQQQISTRRGDPAFANGKKRSQSSRRLTTKDNQRT